MYFKRKINDKFKIKPPNTLHREMVKIIRWQFEQYMKTKKCIKK